MLRVNYITNLDINDIGGGWNGTNNQLYNQLSEHFSINLVGPINPSVNKFEKVFSKLGRTFFGKGDFYFFSDNRLMNIARSVITRLDTEAVFDFFLGSTSWLQYHPQKPYACLLDASFPTYIKVYHNESLFSTKLLKNIYDQERNWLNKAAFVFYTSEWAKRETLLSLGLQEDEHKHKVVKYGGNIPVPLSDTYNATNKGIHLLYISLNFKQKGGYLLWEAFTQIREFYPETVLHIIGEQPPEAVLQEKGIKYHGRLDKRIPQQLDVFNRLLATATLLIHPTKMDATPNVIIEAAYFGCPSVAPNLFGIPDLIIDRQTGRLVPENFTVGDIVETIIDILSNLGTYEEMRRRCREYALKQLTWVAVAEKIIANVEQYVTSNQKP